MRGTGSLFVIGETGRGKSSLCKLLTSDSNNFTVGDGAESSTMFVTSAEVETFELDTKRFTVFDTPGLNDSDGRDAQFVQEMYQKLCLVRNCSAFILVTDVNPRLSGSERTNIAYFRDMFGHAIIQNLAVVFSRVSKYTYEEELDFKSLEEKTKAIASIFGTTEGNIPKFFFQSKLNDQSKRYQEEQEFRTDQLQKMLVWADKRSTIDCSGAKLVETKEELLAKEMEKLGQQKKEAEEQAQQARMQAEAARRAAEQAEAIARYSFLQHSPSYDYYYDDYDSDDYSSDDYDKPSRSKSKSSGRSSSGRSSSGRSSSGRSSSSSATVYSGVGRPRETDYTRSGNLRRK